MTELAPVSPPLTAPLRQVLGVRAAERLASLGLETVHDLITYWPRSWRVRGQDSDLALIPDGEAATVHATVTRATEVNLKGSKRTFLSVTCATSHGRTLEVTFFSPWQARKDGIKAGAQVTLSGKVKTFKGKRQMANPEYVFDQELSQSMAGSCVSVYRATAQASSSWIAEQVQAVLAQLDTLFDPVPGYVREHHTLPDYDWAVRQMHAPTSPENADLARRRLTYDEALAIQLTLALRRRGAHATPARALPGAQNGLLAQFDARLPFVLTSGQIKAGQRIRESLNSTKPTNALIEGDVGSGKTLVALRAMLQAVDSGAQCAFVAPTDVLASQHYESLSEMVSHLDLTVALLSASMPAAARRLVEQGMADGSIDIVIGTQVLTTGKATFANLGLVIVDEQHRFGVAARDALRDQPVPPHMIVMTATPIPRTLAMTVYGDLDVITISGAPRGRKPITSVVVPLVKQNWVERLWTKLSEEIAQGRQVFIVAPLIESALTGTAAGDDEVADTEWTDGPQAMAPASSVSDLVEAVRTHLPSVSVSPLHGRMDAPRKHEVMSAFAAGDLDVLVSTTVIEVGVNVPNASVMVIWDAERFGIAQLHQLRGRVGRGEHAGLCLLVTGSPEGHPSRQRLNTVARTLDGHQLALADLLTRREGDILGTGQAGRSTFKLLSLISGQSFIKQARDDAEVIVTADPALRSQEHRGLALWLKETVGADAAQNLTRS